MKKERKFLRYAKAALEEYRKKDLRTKDMIDIIGIRMDLVQHGDSAINQKKFLLGLRCLNLEKRFRKVMFKELHSKKD